jgi:hypothetical protein
MAPHERFCRACGNAVAPAPGASSGRVLRHLSTLGILWIALSAIRLLRGGGQLFASSFVDFFGHTWLHHIAWGWPLSRFLERMLFISGGMLVALAIAGFIAGWGLLERCAWARPLALILAFLALLNPVLGTLLGIYTLWVLLPAQSEYEYRQIAC